MSMATIDYRSSTTLETKVKYKPHIKELERENRYLEKVKDKEIQYQRLLADWEAREKDFEESKLKIKQKEYRRLQELPDLILDEIKYCTEINFKAQKGKFEK
jgi:hypothetical protein